MCFGHNGDTAITELTIHLSISSTSAVVRVSGEVGYDRVAVNNEQRNERARKRYPFSFVTSKRDVKTSKTEASTNWPILSVDTLESHSMTILTKSSQIHN